MSVESVSSTEAHPAEEQWERLALHELDAQEKATLVDHASGCWECGRVLRALELLERGALRVDPQRSAVLTARPKRRRPLFGIALAAAATVLLALGLAALRDRLPPPAPTVRAPAEDRPLPLGPKGALTSQPLEFRWRPASEGTVFRVELLNEDGSVLWKSAATSETSLSWPGDVEPRPGRHYWRVLETSEDGKVRASPMTSFDLRLE